MAAKKTAKRTAQYKTRTPAVKERDPKPATRKPRRYIPASMPTVCPVINPKTGEACGHNTRMSGGRYKDPVNRKIVEYRTCVKCGALLAAGRDMTRSEAERFCTHADAVKDYQETQND